MGALVNPEPYETVKARGFGGIRLRCLLLQIVLPLAEAGETVHHGAVREGALRRRDVFALARPCLLRGGLQRAAVAEGEPPRAAANSVYRIEMGGRLLVRLTAGEEGDAGYGGGDAGPAQVVRLFRDLVHAGPLLRLLARDHHAAAEYPAFERAL